MSQHLKSSNRFFAGVLQSIGFIGYAYYFHWSSIEFNHYFNSQYIGYVLSTIILLAFGVIFTLSGRFFISVRLGKRNSIHARLYKIEANNDTYGVTKPIIEYKRKLDRILESISETNFTIDDNLLVSLYTHGLYHVKDRFWTTTYLTSGFWAHGRRDVLKANEAMLERLNADGNNGNVRRLFLLRNNLNDEIKFIGNKITDLKSKGENGEIAINQLLIDFQNLKQICDSFKEKKCQIKYIYDEFDHSSIGVFKNKTEIAIYDNFRVDHFEGGEDAKIVGIKVFTENHDLFDEKKSELTSYFESLWDRAIPIDVLFKDLERAYHYYSQKIDYTFSWLIKFDNDLFTVDKVLKDEEIGIVFRYLDNYDRLKDITNYLDIGTCTGRYPFTLTVKLTNCSTLGIDIDDECIEYCNIQKAIHLKQSTAYKKTIFKRMDFISENIENKKFDLITCMLGTISHFAWNKSEDFNDDLQKSIEKMKFLLADNGLLIISNWTEFGLNSHILSIYEHSDQQKLRNFSCKTETLKKRLGLYFASIHVETTSDLKLDLIFCRNHS